MAKPGDIDYRPTPDDWIVVPRWTSFQHYDPTKRKPLWIKVYARLLHDPRYLGLSLASRGLLTAIWLAYSQENGHVSVKDLNKITGNRASISQLVSLNQAGFIRFAASRPLATNVEVEVEKEKEGSKGPKQDRELRSRALNLAADWRGGDSVEFTDSLDALERELRTRLRPVEREELWDIAFRRDRE